MDGDGPHYALSSVVGSLLHAVAVCFALYELYGATGVD